MKRPQIATTGPAAPAIPADQAAVDRAARQILELAYDLLEERRRQERAAQLERRVLVQ